MGHIIYNAIVVTSRRLDDLHIARGNAIFTGLICSEIIDSPFNAVRAFLIAPNGSKVEWEDYKKEQELRLNWIRYVRDQSLSIDWAQVAFGGDLQEGSSLTDHSGIFPGDHEPITK